jgi:hypothetical protein
MNPFQTIVDAQKIYFASGVTRTCGWPIEQLGRVAKLFVENEASAAIGDRGGFQDRQAGICLRDSSITRRNAIAGQSTRRRARCAVS